MTNRRDGAGLLRGLRRARGQGDPRVTPLELFFDLVFVFAVTQLSHLLGEHLDVGGALQTALLLLVVWLAWIYTAWFTNWFDPERRAVRLVLVGVMLCSLIMSAALPEAFGERGLLFAGAFVTMQIGRHLFAFAAFRDEPEQYRNFQRIVTWAVASGVLWLAGGVADGSERVTLWVAAVTVDVLAPMLGYYVPGLGRSLTTVWTISGGHMAERCQLFIIIALGESILVSGITFGQLPFSTVTLAALLVTFLGSVALWWVYFDRTAEYASAVIAQSPDPGRLGRSAYTYYHIPMVAGVIVTAVGDELVIAHPTGATSMATAAVVLGGPALFLAGHALFKWSVFGHISIPRLVAVAALAALVPVSLVVPPLALSTVAALVVAAIAGWDTWSVGRHPLPSARDLGAAKAEEEAREQAQHGLVK